MGGYGRSLHRNGQCALWCRKVCVTGGGPVFHFVRNQFCGGENYWDDVLGRKCLLSGSGLSMTGPPFHLWWPGQSGGNWPIVMLVALDGLWVVEQCNTDSNWLHWFSNEYSSFAIFSVTNVEIEWNVRPAPSFGGHLRPNGSSDRVGVKKLFIGR